MPRLKSLKLDFDWKLVKTNADDLENAERRTLLLMLLEMNLVRSFEKTLLRLKEENLVHGPVHASVGQEAVAVGAMHAIRPRDLIGGTHRAHHQFLAKAITCYTPQDYDPLNSSFTPQMQEAVNRLLAEIMGLAPGFCGGRGGSMHLYDATIGVLGTNAIVGGGIPIATGAAWAQKYKNEDRTVVSFFSDGAVNQGAFHEALNLAGLWKIPVIYIIENNLYAVATPVGKSTPVKHLSLRAVSYNMKARLVDGMDPLAVKIAVEEATRSLSREKMPFLIEATTYRFLHHAGNIPGSKFGYRQRKEEEKWENLDPLITFPRKLKECGFLSEEGDRYLKEVAKKSVQEAVEYCTEQDEKPGRRRIKATLWPKLESLSEGLHGDENKFEGIEFIEETGVTLDRKVKYVDAIAEITEHWLGKDRNVFVIGEEVANFGGGAYQATRGLPEKYPGRIINTPISEAGFSGLACGAAICGLRPIVEIMFPDFMLVSADQVFNQIGKLRYIYGGKVEIPLLMRTRVAIGCGYGGQHSMDPVAIFALFPGWKVVAPATPFDYIGLFNSAMQSKGPVLIVEHHELYDSIGFVPSGNYEYCIQIGKAKKITEGKDVTVLSYSSTATLAKKAAEELSGEGIAAEVIDLRTLNLADIDYETIGTSLRKTNTLVIVEQAPKSNSIGATIACECQSRFFDFFDCPPSRLTGLDIPNPVSKVLEMAALPCLESVKDIIRKAVQRDS